MVNTFDFAAVLNQCQDPDIGQAVLRAVDELFRRDIQLLQLGAKEEAIAAHLAYYLRPSFSGFSVDVEYNLMGEVPKEVTYDKDPQRVYPDIIVHIRNNAAQGIPDRIANILAIEIKKDTNPEASERDLRKLRAYRRELDYRCALFMRFGTGQAGGTLCECHWVIDLHEN